MGYIADISKYQEENEIDWPVFAKNFDLIIARVQYGSTGPDKMYNSHIANCKKYGVPFNTYTFPAFISVNDARVEARDCWNRTDKDSEVIWIDIESEYDSNRRPVGITKLSQSVRLEGIKAYTDELRKQGAKKVGAYIAHNVYETWEINTIVGIFDAIWIPRYGSNNGQPSTKPDYPCHLWQYTSVGRLPGYDKSLDLNLINGNLPLSYFTGKGTPEAIQQPVASPENTSSGGLAIGTTATVKRSATHYATGQEIADFVKGNKYKIIQARNEVKGLSKKSYLLDGIMSWVLEQDIEESGVGNQAPASKQSAGIPIAGHIKIVGVNHAAIVMDSPDRNHSNNIGTIPKGTIVAISGSVRGKNNPRGYWEVIFNGRRAYVSGQFGDKI